MKQIKIDIFISTIIDKIPSKNILSVRARLEKIDDNRLERLQSLNYKNPIILLIVSIFLGSWGIDRFMLGQTGLGVLKLLTCGGLGIWTVIDWFTIMETTKEMNFQLFRRNAR